MGAGFNKGYSLAAYRKRLIYRPRPRAAVPRPRAKPPNRHTVIMSLHPHANPPLVPAPTPVWRRLLPLGIAVLLLLAVYAMGWHRELSLATLVRHRDAIDGFVI